MTPINFLIMQSVLLVMGSFFITGFYFITRDGKIFQFWSLFWEHIYDYKNINYEDRDLELKLMELKRLNSKLGSRLWITGQKKCMSLSNNSPLSGQEIFDIEETVSVLISVEGDMIFFYWQKPIYRFHKNIRRPISECPPCMSSVIGSVFYWGMFLILSNFVTFDKAESAWLGMWFFYCVSVSIFNKFIVDKLNL